MQQVQPPSVGRVVHYQDLVEKEPIAAIIVAAPHPESGVVGLFIMDPARKQAGFLDNIPFSPTALPGHWSWPPRVASTVVP